MKKLFLFLLLLLLFPVSSFAVVCTTPKTTGPLAVGDFVKQEGVNYHFLVGGWYIQQTGASCRSGTSGVLSYGSNFVAWTVAGSGATCTSPSWSGYESSRTTTIAWCDPPTCSDGAKNGTETGVDCGGSCNLCPPPATCTDGIKNQGETGIDCGGPCSPCVPAHCTNAIKDPQEVGLNCGGACPAVCEKQCPQGYQTASNYENLQHVILFGFINGGDYSNDPDACVQITSTDNDSGCTNTWLSYGPEGNKTIACGNLHSAYYGPSGTPPPPVIEITFPDGGAPPVLTPPPAEIPPAAPEVPPNVTGQNCVEKTMSDGSQCTICTSSTGSGSVTCTGADGTLALTKPTETTPIVDGCNTITYGNGTTCLVCRNSVTGAQTVNCTDSTQNPVPPGSESPTAIGDGLLGSIDKKIGDVRGQLQGVGSGITDVVSNTQKGNALQTEANKYLKNLSEKGVNVTISNTGVEAKLNTANYKLGGIEAASNITNTHLEAIKADTNIFAQKFTDATPSEVQTSSDAIGSGIDSGLDASGNALNSAAQGVVDGFDPSTFSPFANVTNRLATLFPSPGACNALVINWTPTIQTVIPCEPFDRFKEIFAWVLYIWTSFYIIETLFASRSSGSRKD